MSSISPVIAIVLVVLLVALGLAVAWLVVRCRMLVSRLTDACRQLSACMELAPFCAYAKDIDGRYIYENRKLIDCTRRCLPHITSFIGRTDRDFFPADQAEQYMADDREVIRTRTPIAFTNTSTDVDGEVHHWATVKFPWIDDRGRDCVIGLSVDSTEVRRAQQNARLSEDRCRLALEAGRMGSMSLDLKTLMLDVSDVFAMLHGSPSTKQLSFQDCLARLHPDDRPNVEKALTATLDGFAPRRLVYRVIKDDGTIAWIELVGDVCNDDDGRPAVLRAVGFDVTDRLAAVEELKNRKGMLRRLLEVQENERQTLCHELHDGMMQYAIGAKMLLESVRDDTASAALAERLDSALECLTRGIAEGRQVIRGVRSAVLDDLGLGAAIEDLGDQLAAAGVTVSLDLDTDLESLEPKLRTTVYRVVQESLANVRKHAETDRASVTIRRTPGDIQVFVRDAGRGFDVDEARRRGFGLVGMIERVRLAGGACTIESRPGSGAEVTARLPVPDDNEAAAATAPAGAYAAATPDVLAR